MQAASSSTLQQQNNTPLGVLFFCTVYFLYMQKKNFLARGFTLVELLTVIAIIGILASIILVNLQGAKQKGRDAKRTADIKNIQLALAEYYNDTLKYPTNLSTLSPTYLSVVPTDPLTNAGYFYVGYSGNGTTNCFSTGAVNYHLGAALEANSTITGDANLSASPSTVCSQGTMSDFDGRAPSCLGTSPDPSGANNCYDVTSN